MLKKIFIRSLSVLLSLVFLIIALFVIANWGDQDLRHEVEAELHWQAPKEIVDSNGFVLLQGMTAKEGVDPVVLGRRKLAAELQRFEEHRHKMSYDPIEPVLDSDEVRFQRGQAETCAYTESANCVAFYLSREVKDEQAILHARKSLLANFDRLKASATYLEIMPPHIGASIPQFSPLMHAAELQRMRAIRLIADGNPTLGLTELLQVADFSQRWLANSSSLVSHMIALASLQRDLRILDELLVRFPELLKEQAQIQTWLSRFSLQKMSMDKAFKTERQVSLQVMHAALGASTNRAPDPALSWAQRLLTKLISRPNAALNLTYDWNLLLETLAQQTGTAYIEMKVAMPNKRKALLGLGFANVYLRDPVAKILLGVSSPGFETYIERHADVFAQANLLAVKLDLLTQKIAEENIPQFIQSQAAQYAAKYGVQAVKWDADKHLISVALRQNSNQGYQKEKVIRSKL